MDGVEQACLSHPIGLSTFGSQVRHGRRIAKTARGFFGETPLRWCAPRRFLADAFVLPSPAPMMMPVAVATVEDTAGQSGKDQGTEDDSQSTHVMHLPIGEQ